MRRLLRILSVSLITAGLVLLVDAGLTLAWKEPLSAAYSTLRQNAASAQLEVLERSFSADFEGGRSARIRDPEKRAKSLAADFEDELRPGRAIGRIEVDSAGIDYVLIQGTSEADLKKGPGHYPETALPGQGRTVGVAGHRTTYGAPFNQIDAIGRGDEVVVRMPYGRFTYEVQKTEIVDPNAVEIVDDVGYDRIVLTACHPLYSAAQRYAVFARLADVEPLG